MFILDALGNVRTILLTIDQVAYSSIDNAYNMITKFARAEFFTNEAVVSIMRSTYIIIGLLALFKIALLLINAMISPDKLFEKGAGLGGIVKNICIMFVLLIAVPVLFNESMKIQQVIVDNDYVNRLFGINAGSNSNIGDMFKTSAISALINPDSDIATLTTTTDASGNKIRQYVLRTKDKVGAEKATAAGEKCSSSNSSTHCEDAINDYNKAVLSNDQTARNHMFSTLINHVGDYIKTDGGQIYVYNYSMLITFIVGIGITYLLILFSFDLAERAIKLAILEVVSPLFIVTYIDPKSAKSGPFSSWLKEVGGTYVGLYIRLAALTLIIVLTNLWNSRKGDIDLGFWGEIVFILSLLIFAKQFPKWLAGLVGIKDFDGGLGGLGKKIGSAALVGGMLTKAGHTAYAAARGSVATAHAYRKAKKTGLSSEKERAHNRVKSNYSSNRAAGDGRVKSAFKGIGQSYFKKDAMKQNLKNFGTTAAAGGLGFLKGVASGGKIGVSGADLKDINAKVKADAKGEFNRLAPDYNSFANRAGNFISGIHGKGVESIIGNSFELDKRKTEAEKSQKARELFGSVTTGSDGKRNKLANPVNSMEANELVGNTNTKYGTKFDASSMEGITSSLVLANKDKIKGKVEVVDGKVQIDGKNVDTAKVCRDNGIYTPYGEKTMESIAKENAYTKASEYVSNQQNISEANKSAVDSAAQMQSLVNEMKSVTAAAGKNITTQLADMSNCLNNEYSANLKLNEALAKSVDPSETSKPTPAEIQVLKDELAAAITAKGEAIENLTNKIVESSGDSGLVDSFIAAASSRAEAFSQIELLNGRNKDIKEEVRRSLEEANANGTTSNFTTVDITTGQRYTFLQDPTQTELVSNLMNKAVAKAKDDASKLKPKSSDDKK